MSKVEILTNKTVSITKIHHAGSKSMNKSNDIPMDISPNVLTEMFKNKTIGKSQSHSDGK